MTDPEDMIDWGAFNANGIPGVTYDGTTVTFSNVTLTVTDAPNNVVVSDIVMNGSLGE